MSLENRCSRTVEQEDGEQEEMEEDDEIHALHHLCPDEVCGETEDVVLSSDRKSVKDRERKESEFPGIRQTV